MSGFNLPGGPRPSGPWHTALEAAPASAGSGAAPALPAGWGDWSGGMVARPGPDQLNTGGHNMSMPPMGSGMATGAMAAAPPQGYGAPQSQPGFAGGVYSLDPALWSRGYAQSKGFDPHVSSPFGDWFFKFLGQIAQPIFDMTLGQGGQPALDVLSNPAAIMDKLLYGGGGTAYGNIANYAKQALGGQGGNLRDMPYDAALKFLNSVDTLSGLGMNPYQQAAQGRRFQNNVLDYEQQNQMNTAAGRGTPQDLWSFLQGRGY